MIPTEGNLPGYESLRQAFRDRTGQEPEGIWRAPGRVNLIGEHTDYNDGLVLPIAIDRQATVAGRVRTDGVLRVWSLQQDSGPSAAVLGELTPGSVSGWAAYVAGTAWSLAEKAGRLKGADLVIDSDVPLGAGLSSSAALEVSAGLALSELNEKSLEARDLALIAQRAENDFVGVPCGIMDQMASACAEAGNALLIDTRTLDTQHVPFELNGRGADLVVIDTRTSHSLKDGEYAKRREGCREAARLLGVPALRDIEQRDLPGAAERLPESLFMLVRHVVTENGRVRSVVRALEEGKLQQVGRAMNASHESLRDDYRVSSPELDLAVDVARLAGAYGARMTGGGFGGSAIALIPDENAPHLETEARTAFSQKNAKEPAFFPVRPAAGASRVWP